MSDLDVSDHMRPQDGRTKIRIGGAEVGLRVSTLPTSYGEKVVIRILDQRVAEVPLEKLGFAPEVSAVIKTALSASQGMLLITGPTGSGKTTTLYSMLDKARHEGTNIVTVEDPIEYKLTGINQVQVNERQGLTFASVLRSVLRQDPDIIMVGEIRDRETADIAFQAAMTGHLVFSTLHTNDTVSTIARLSDMGVDRFKISPSLLAITAQRLVRKLCPVCAERVPAGELDKAVLGAMTAYGLDPVAYRARGCRSCDNSGYEGRTALVEILNMTPHLKELISSGARAAEISRAALESSALRTITNDALWHLSKGHTDLKEIAQHLILTGPEFGSPRAHDAAPHVFQERRKAQTPAPQAEPARPPEHTPLPAPHHVLEHPKKHAPHAAPEHQAPPQAHHAAPEHPKKHAPAQPPHPAPERVKSHVHPPAPPAGHERRKHQAPHTGHERRKTAAHPPAAQHAAPKPPPPKLRVMVAEDNDLMRMLLKKFLEDAGFEAVLAADGEEALTAIASGTQPDILVSDLNMPRMNGFELVKGVRESLGIKDMPILILTTNNTNKSQELAFRMGADDYICKPFNAPLFISRIHAALLRADRIK
jgi:Tfp pilus assembly pilus retraction ATPase PilT/CheY-like chemotaxis protein